MYNNLLIYVNIMLPLVTFVIYVYQGYALRCVCVFMVRDIYVKGRGVTGSVGGWEEGRWVADI